MMTTKFPTLLAAASLTFVAACDPNGPNDYEHTQQGAVIGAGLGALVGAATGDTAEERRRGALIGAILGGGTGAAIGNNLDLQEEELRNQLGNNVGIVNTGDQLIVTLSQDILFATDSTVVSSVSRSDLITVASSLNRYPDTTINVIGHTDNVGTASYNYDLSQRRARSVSSVLMGAGVSSGRIRSIGRGEDQPIATNLTPEGRQQNRRVEIVITPN